MARWGEEVIGRVKEGNDVVDVLSGYMALTRAGSNYKGLCPFHNEKSPSFMVSPARQMWHCFGCGEGGDVIRFVMKHEGLPFVEALRKLADKAGVELPEQDASAGAGQDARAPLFRANRLAADFYREALMRGEAGKPARDYLSARGIHAEVCKAFGVGYAPPGWQTLEGALAGEGVTPEQLLAAGLTILPEKSEEKGRRPYDRFRDRVVFPIRDLSGRVLGFGGRTMDPQGVPKYLNSPETAVYHKGDFLYALDLAAPHIRAAGEVILVEGYLDVIALHQAGMGNVVGVLGTALTGEQAARLRRVAPRVVLLFDGDEAGTKAALRSGLILLEGELECRVTPLTDGEDPDSFVRRHGVEALREKVRQSPPLVTFVLAEARRRDPGADVPARMKVFDAIRPFMAKIRNKVELALYLEEAAQVLGVRAQDVRDEVLGGRKGANPPPVAVRQARGAREGGALAPLVVPFEEKQLVQLLLREPALVAALSGDLDPAELSGPGMRELAASLMAGPERLASFLAGDAALSGFVSRLELEELSFPPENWEVEARGCLRKVRARTLKRRLVELHARLGELEQGQGGRDEMEKVQQEIGKVQVRCRDLERS